MPDAPEMTPPAVSKPEQAAPAEVKAVAPVAQPEPESAAADAEAPPEAVTPAVVPQPAEERTVLTTADVEAMKAGQMRGPQDAVRRITQVSPGASN